MTGTSERVSSGASLGEGAAVAALAAGVGTILAAGGAQAGAWIALITGPRGGASAAGGAAGGSAVASTSGGTSGMGAAIDVVATGPAVAERGKEGPAAAAVEGRWASCAPMMNAPTIARPSTAPTTTSFIDDDRGARLPGASSTPPKGVTTDATTGATDVETAGRCVSSITASEVGAAGGTLAGARGGGSGLMATRALSAASTGAGEGGGSGGAARTTGDRSGGGSTLGRGVPFSEIFLRTSRRWPRLGLPPLGLDIDIPPRETVQK